MTTLRVHRTEAVDRCQHRTKEAAMEIDTARLFAAAEAATEGSYSPYSRFRVGAALLLDDGRIVTGANIENRSYGLTQCAERTAVCTAVAAGSTRFLALAVHCPDADYPVPPCGACRQVIGEFTSGDFPIYYSGADRRYVRSSTGELLPHDSLHELR
jgi:cytidine deaminase